MGLDSYLSATKYVGGGWKYIRKENPESPEVVMYDGILDAVGLGPTDQFQERFPEAMSADVTVRVGYWRKANAIHAWFVEHAQGGVDDCRSAYVSRETLEELRDTCKRVLEDSDLGAGVPNEWGGTDYPNAVVDEDTASAELPTQSGFFFGGTEYDEYYLHDLIATVALIDAVLEDPRFEGWDFEYRSSW